MTDSSRSLEIRRLTYADLPQVVAIERRAFPTPWSLAMFVLELSKPGGICLAAFDGETMLGYVICSRYDTVWHLMNVSVDPSRRREKIATALLTALIERMADPTAELTLEVRRSNLGAIALYERFGFRSAGIRRRYYQDNGEDALIMWRTPATLRGALGTRGEAGEASAGGEAPGRDREPPGRGSGTRAGAL
jgi:ribosomal-protein-alanine N-acetyltransferase